jgi:hypothetical protein
MSSIIVAILLLVAIVAAVYFLVKKLSVVIGNAVVGLIPLVILNFFNIMQWMEQTRPWLWPCNDSYLCHRGNSRGLHPCPPRYPGYRHLIKEFF